jgi:hypothetical protein
MPVLIDDHTRRNFVEAQNREAKQRDKIETQKKEA